MTGGLLLLPGMWKCLGVRERVGVAGLEDRGELRPLDGSVPPNKKRRKSGRKKTRKKGRGEERKRCWNKFGVIERDGQTEESECDETLHERHVKEWEKRRE